MKGVTCYIYSILLYLLPLPGNGQSTTWGYQLILESKNQYDHSDKASSLSSKTELYPIVTVGNELGGLLNTLQAEGNLTNYNFTKDSVRFTFQELYTRFSWKDRHHWTIGKKRLDWGTGMIWNPTNFYIQKDPFRTQNRLEGIFLLTYTCLFNTGSLEVYVFPEKEVENFSYSLKYNYTGERVDASISFLGHTQKQQQIGYDISYGGDRFTAYAEGVFRNDHSGKRFCPEIVSGASYVFNASLSARLEYRFRENDLTLYDPVSVGKHTLYASAESKDVYDRFNLQVRTFFDLCSNQLIVSPLFIWKMNNFQIELSSMIFTHSFAIYNSQTSLLLSCHF
ncbi:MAG: hypothetical protein LBK45_05025 [Tannerellaceae bacterium]|jgi:hypothetical protein|nr:hypothetical protein [Tannerellaceae bacterium]